MIDPRSEVLTSVNSLAEKIDSGSAPVILDISDDLSAKPLDRPVIPGAIAVCLASDISGPATKEGGRRPLPEADILQSTLRQFGISSDSDVVVYDSATGAQAGRAWWTLRWAGHNKVRVLDGGFKAWAGAGNPSQIQPTSPPGNGDIIVSPGCMPTIDASEAASIACSGVLLDARGKAAYEGDPEKPDTGHIPGAVCAPSAETVTADGFIKTSEDLEAHFRSLGIGNSEPTGVYCGSGNAAAHELVALYAAGFSAALYVGSWSAWTGDPTRPVAQGPQRD